MPRKAGKSPTERTMEVLRERGYRVCQVERWIPGSGTRKDMFGFGDLIAIKPGQILAVQCGTGSHHAGHKTKIIEETGENALAWIEAGGEIEIWSWRMVVKFNKDGTKSKVKGWEPRVEPITRMDLCSQSPSTPP